MKRFFPVLISIILVFSLILTGCNSHENTAASSKDALSANEEYITTAFSEDEVLDKQYTFSEFKEIVGRWADENNITIECEADNYLVLSKKASGAIKNAESFTFHTAIDLRTSKSFSDATQNSISNAAAVMTAIGCVQNHGPVNAVFTNVKNGRPIGADQLDPTYLECDNFIDVTYSEDTVLYNSFAADTNMAAVKSLDITSPTYTKAYKVTFSGITGQSAYNNKNHYPNPIKTIGDLLASCQTSTVLFELASFEGGLYSDQIPGNVTVTIVLHENDVENFTKKFNNSYEKVEEQYEDVDGSFEYTMMPVTLPDYVISKEDTENIVSLMYTMINGTYYRNDNDEVVAISNIGKISTKDAQFKLNINAKSLNNETMTELEGVVKTICGLSDIKYRKLNGSKVWTNAPDSPLVMNISEAVDASCSPAMEMRHVAKLIAADKDINLVSWGTNSDDAAKDLEKIFEYMAIAGVETATE